jgi:hypothetical protein
VILAIADLFAIAAAVFAASGIRQPRRLPQSVWLLVAVALVAGAWNVVRLPFERRWIERVASAASQQRPNLPQNER